MSIGYLSRVLLVRAYIDGEVREMMLFTENGFVVKVRSYIDKALCRDYECLDLRAYGIALPGFIDIHTHLRGLKLSYKEDEESGTKAAARGGYTAVVDMPNTVPRINTVSSLRDKLEALAKKSSVDYGVCISPTGNLDEFISMLNTEGVVCVGEIFPEEYRYIGTVLRILRERKFDKFLMIHPEHPDYIKECGAGLRWSCRPIEAELKAVEYVGSLARHGDRIHITHITNVETLNYAKSLNFTVDTCPHYLYLSSEDEERFGCIAKVNPPLRGALVRDGLVKNIRHVDAIATDHAPHSYEEKMRTFDECPPGIASLDIATSLTLNLVNRGFLTIDDVVKMLSQKPAQILGARRWGCFYEGCVASYTVVDLNAETVVDSQNFFSKAKFSPYNGMKLKGLAKATIVRGAVVYVDGDFVEKQTLQPLTRCTHNES